MSAAGPSDQLFFGVRAFTCFFAFLDSGVSGHFPHELHIHLSSVTRVVLPTLLGSSIRSLMSRRFATYRRQLFLIIVKSLPV